MGAIERGNRSGVMPRPEQRRSNGGRSLGLQRGVLLPSKSVFPQRGEEIGSEWERKVGGKELQKVVVMEVVAGAFSEEGAEARQDLRDR